MFRKIAFAFLVVSCCLANSLSKENSSPKFSIKGPVHEFSACAKNFYSDDEGILYFKDGDSLISFNFFDKTEKIIFSDLASEFVIKCQDGGKVLFYTKNDFEVWSFDALTNLKEKIAGKGSSCDFLPGSCEYVLCWEKEKVFVLHNLMEKNKRILMSTEAEFDEATSFGVCSQKLLIEDLGKFVIFDSKKFKKERELPFLGYFFGCGPLNTFYAYNDKHTGFFSYNWQSNKKRNYDFSNEIAEISSWKDSKYLFRLKTHELWVFDGKEKYKCPVLGSLVVRNAFFFDESQIGVVVEEGSKKKLYIVKIFWGSSGEERQE